MLKIGITHYTLSRLASLACFVLCSNNFLSCLFEPCKGGGTKFKLFKKPTIFVNFPAKIFDSACHDHKNGNLSK